MTETPAAIINEQETGCSQPHHCPCGCGAHVGCFIYGDEDPMSQEETETMEALPQFAEIRAERSSKGHLLWLRADGTRA